jgi:hypothetical protein
MRQTIVRILHNFITNTKFHKNTFRRSRAIRYGRTDVTRLIVAYLRLPFGTHQNQWIFLFMSPRQAACGRFQFPLSHHTLCPHGLSIPLSLLYQTPEQYLQLHHHAFYQHTFQFTVRYQTPSHTVQSEIWTASLNEVQINTLTALTNSKGYARHFTKILAAFRIWWAVSLRRTEYSALYRTESHVNIYIEATAFQREWNWTLLWINKKYI